MIITDCKLSLAASALLLIPSSSTPKGSYLGSDKTIEPRLTSIGFPVKDDLNH